ncbi:MAG: hypothetical protein ACE5H1_06605, partial [Thermodesulfobacteriota bacterium]
MSGFFEKLPEFIKNHVASDLPKEKRLIAARGEITAESKELVLILYWLTKDSDEEVSNQAVKSINSISQDIISSLVDDETTPPEFLDYLARASSSEDILQQIISNDATLDSTIAFLAENVHNQSLVELIVNNHNRIMRSHEILEAVSRNPSVGRTTMEQVLSQFKHYLDTRDNVQDDYIDKSDSLTSTRIKGYETSIERDEAGPEVEASEDDQKSFLDEIELSDDLIEETEEQITEKKRESMLFTIKQMNMGERLKLAMVGNSEARAILIRDSNRIIACAALKNPMITESEIVLIAQSKIVDEEILRLISESRKWVRLYQVKHSLICNPKTPSHISLNFIRHIRDRDLKSIMNDKNLPGIVASAA